MIAEILLYVLVGSFALVFLVSVANIFVKADAPWWVPFVPIYRFVVIAKLTGSPWWFGLLAELPITGVVFMPLLVWRFLRCYNKDIWYAIALMVFPVITLIAWGLDDSTYALIRYERPEALNRYADEVRRRLQIGHRHDDISWDLLGRGGGHTRLEILDFIYRVEQG